MEQRVRNPLRARGVSVRGDNIDTDQIIPGRFLKRIGYDHLGERIFQDERTQFQEQGKVHPLDNPAFSQAEILFVNKNFGCGSSREHAPQSLSRYKKGIKAIIGESFAEIFSSNCLSLGIWCLTVSESVIQDIMESNERAPELIFCIDLTQKLIMFSESSYDFSISDGHRQQLLSEEQDSISTFLKNEALIEKMIAKLPYMNNYAEVLLEE